MKITKPKKVFCTVFMAFLISNIPNVVLAESLINSKNEMIETRVVLADITRADAEKNVRDYLLKSEVQSEFIKHGVSTEEISARLATLSEQEIRQLSVQVKEAHAGGEVLVTILLVLLIIYIFKLI